MQLPQELAHLELSADQRRLTFTFDSHAEQSGIPSLLKQMSELKIDVQDLKTTESSLEEIFVKLVSEVRESKIHG